MNKEKMKMTMYKSSLLILLVSCSLILFGFSFQSDNVSYIDTNHSEQHEIEWITIEEAMELHSKMPKYWIIDIYTDWCGWCKRMDATTFKDPYVTEEISKNYYAVKFNAEAKRDITVGDKTYKFVPSGKRGYHELAAQLLSGKMSYPSIAYMNKEGGLIQTIPGYKTAEDIHPILKYFSSESYTKIDWPAYQENYESPYKSE